MKIIIDTEKRNMIITSENKNFDIDLYSKEAFEILSEQWKKIGWNQKHIYTFSWMGRPIIQLPEDMIRVQEVIYNVKPDVIIETGIAHGGSLIYYASILKAIGNGRVIGVDIEIRNHNRNAIENHELFPLITLIEGSSVDENILQIVKNHINTGEKVMVLLDSCHTTDHVYNELDMYSKIVSKDSYIVVQDGVMEDLWDVPRGQDDWKHDNPVIAIDKFLSTNTNFIYEKPEWTFNESTMDKNITHWKKAWLRKIK